MILVTRCQTAGKQDSGGRLMSLSAAKLIPLEQADLHLPRFLSIDGVVIEKTISDNGTSSIDRYEVNGRILSKSERLADNNLFSEDAQRKIGNPWQLKELLNSKANKYGANNRQSAPSNRSGKKSATTRVMVDTKHFLLDASSD
jgi:hypothetical protein